MTPESVRRFRSVLAVFVLTLASPPELRIRSQQRERATITPSGRASFEPGYVPPNILIIVLDDVGTDKLALYGETPPAVSGVPYPVTERLDLLAADGILFTNYYTNPLCSTSRACLLTGRYAFRTQVGSTLDTPTTTCPNAESPDCFRLQDCELFIPELLRRGLPANKSYRSGAFGKWHLSYESQVDSHSLSHAHAVNNGFDQFYGMMSNADPDHFDWTKVQHTFNSAPNTFPSTSWDASVARADAVTWINAQTAPFFAYVAFNPPHTPLQVPPAGLPSAATQAELDALPAPFGDPGHIEPESSPYRQLYYRAMLEAVDTEIGNLLDQIDPLKLANTMVFVVSDNGTQKPMISNPPHNPDHGKSSVYQIGIRVPMIVSGPLVPGGGGLVCDELVNSVDLWRTIEELTLANEDDAFHYFGIYQKPTIDSVSFVPLILNPQATGARTLAFGQVFLRNGRYSLPGQPITCLHSHGRALTNGVYKYIRRQITKPAGVDCDAPELDCSFIHAYEQEFYLLSDVDEQNNLVNPTTGQLLTPNPANQANLDALRDAMLDLSGD